MDSYGTLTCRYDLQHTVSIITFFFLTVSASTPKVPNLSLEPFEIKPEIMLGYEA